MTNDTFYGAATRTIAALGWQFMMLPHGAGILAYPPSETLHLRFTMTIGAAKAIAVEIVDSVGSPVNATSTPIWLMAFDLDPAIAARQIREDLVQPFLRAAQTCPAA